MNVICECINNANTVYSSELHKNSMCIIYYMLPGANDIINFLRTDFGCCYTYEVDQNNKQM